MNKNYSYKEYSNSALFTNIGKRIELKEYRDNLIFYNSCDTNLTADFSYGNNTPEITGTAEEVAENLNNGTFGQYIKNSGSITFDKENFSLFKNTGSLKFRLGVSIENSYGSQRILLKDTFTIVNGDYSFNLKVGTRDVAFIVLTLNSTMTRADIFNAVLVAIDPSYEAEVDVIDITNILIKSSYLGDKIEITSGTVGTDFLSIFSTEESQMANTPLTSTTFLSFENGINNNGKISFNHHKDAVTKNSIVSVVMYNNNGIIATTLSTIWNNDIDKLSSFEFDFNNEIAYLFLDGNVVDFKSTKFIRDYNDCYFRMGSAGDSFPYNFDEIILYSIVSNTISYDVETTPLTKYSTEIPYVDFYFSGGIKEGTVEQCFMDSSNNVSFILYSGEEAFYYMSGSWRRSDGTLWYANDAATFEVKFPTFAFDETKEIKVRAFFESEGTNLSYLEDFEIIIKEEEFEEGALPAILLGNVMLESTVGAGYGLDLTTNYNLVITTDLGTTTVDLTTNAATYDSVLAQEVIDAINTADAVGISKASLNSLNQVYLTGTTKSKNGFISVSGSTAAMVFGGDMTALGQDPITSPVDYSILFGYVKRKLGYPTVPVEITTDQMEDVLKDAINLYNKWRNYSVKTLYVDLAGTSTGGYEIPAIIGSERNIIDVVFKPRTPFGIYDSNSFEYNVYVQQLFSKYGKGGARTGFLTDYSISMNFIADSNIILGTEPRWEVMDRKIHIYPNPPGTLFSVGIKYKGQMTIDEILMDDMVKKYMTGACRKILGTIRSTFGGTVSAGDTTLQMNGTEMTAMGKEEMDEAIKDMKGETEPLGFLIG